MGGVSQCDLALGMDGMDGVAFQVFAVSADTYVADLAHERNILADLALHHLRRAVVPGRAQRLRLRGFHKLVSCELRRGHESHSLLVTETHTAAPGIL